MIPPYSQLTLAGWDDYALVDSGGGRKLERYGARLVDRPDPQAFWPPLRPRETWAADAVFDGGGEDDERGAWSFPRGGDGGPWPVSWRELTLQARCAAFRHMGLFPEHAVHWEWAQGAIRGAGRPVRLLNLFGYTGAMTLAAAAAGAEVTHLDASPKAIAQGRENQTLSGLADRPVRWICDDAMKFMQREERRGRRYDAIVLDPPKFGRGPKNETWRFEADFPALLGLVRACLSERPLFVIATVYAMRLSWLSVTQTLAASLDGLGGEMEAGEMAIAESGRAIALPVALFARWRAGD